MNLNLNALEKEFLDGIEIHFERKIKGSRVITLCVIKDESNLMKSYSYVDMNGIAVCNPSDKDDPVVGARESFENLLSTVKSKYLRKLLRKYYSCGEVRWNCFIENKTLQRGYLYIRFNGDF